MIWEVEYSYVFMQWWSQLEKSEQKSLLTGIQLLKNYGVNLRSPHSSKIKMTKNSHIRELRVQHKGKPYRILYAFDPRRIAVLLVGGNKTSDNRWYEKFVPLADKLYKEYLTMLEEEMSYE